MDAQYASRGLAQSTWSSRASLLRGYAQVLARTGLQNGFDGLRAWIANYVVNDLHVGRGQTRRVGALPAALRGLLAALRQQGSLHLTAGQRELLDQRARGAVEVHASVALPHRAEAMTAQDLNCVFQALPMAGEVSDRRRIRLLAAANSGLLMWQGILRFHDLQLLRIEWTREYILGDRRLFVCYFKDKPRRGSISWRTVHFPQRDDDFDCYDIIRSCMMGRTRGALVAGITARHFTELQQYIAAQRVLSHPFTSHSFRVGGLNALRAVGGDDNLVRLQGGWMSRTSGAQRVVITDVYARVSAAQLGVLAAMGRE